LLAFIDKKVEPRKNFIEKVRRTGIVKERNGFMFPNQFGDYQGMAQMMAWRELQRMREKRKEENGNGDGQALMHLTYCCLCKVGLVLSRCGKAVEVVGQRVAWYAMSKKAENAPWHYH
jgi:hypothetical protein